jgi:hypothetical protein
VAGGEGRLRPSGPGVAPVPARHAAGARGGSQRRPAPPAFAASARLPISIPTGHAWLPAQVCCPLTDHLLGTYVKPTVWTKRMRAVPGPDATERWGVPVEPVGVPQAPIIGAGLATEEDLTPTALLNAPA